MLEDDEAEDRPTFPDDPSVQHGHLATSLSQLRRVVQAGSEPGVVCELMDRLLGDLRLHFAAEEHAMERGEYPQLEEHRERHHKFLRHVEAVRADCADRSKGLSPVVAEQLENWFHDHEQTADAELRAHFGVPR